MSDTYGAEDDTELQPDMPGIGTAPMAPPRGMPGQLGGLAQRALGGRPAPQPAQRGRSPYDFPGQSQIAQGGSGAALVNMQKARDQQRQTGTTSSLISPKGSPQPPANFSPFVRSMPTRHFSQWGEPEQFAPLPSSFEVPGIWQGVSRFFGQNGSALTLPLALALGKNSGDFIAAYQKGMEFNEKMARAKAQDAAAALQQQQEEEHHRYSDVLAKHAALNETDDPDKMLKPVGGLDLLDDLHNTAVQLGDRDMVELIEGGAKVADIMRYQQRRDAALQDLQKANKKADEQTAEDAIWHTDQQPAAASGQPQQPAIPWWQQPGAPAPGQQPTTAGGPAPTPAQPAKDPNAPVNKTESGDDLPADNRSDDQKRLDGRAISLLKGYKPEAGEYGSKNELGLVGRRMTDMRNTMSDIARDPNLKTRQQILNAVAQRISPEAADDLAAYADYARGPGGTSSGGEGPEREYYDLLTPLAQKMKPGNQTTGIGGWNKGNFKAQSDFRTNPATQTVLLRTNGLAADGRAVRDDLAYLEAHGRSATGLDLNQILEMAERDPIYAKLYGDWLAYNDAFNTIVTGGRHVESGAQAQVATAPTSYASPAAFRAAMKGHMNDAYGMIEGEHRRWETAGGGKDDMPSYNPAAEKDIRDMRDMDWLTGTLPGQKYTFEGVTKTWMPRNSLDPHDPANWQ